MENFFLSIAKNNHRRLLLRLINFSLIAREFFGLEFLLEFLLEDIQESYFRCIEIHYLLSEEKIRVFSNTWNACARGKARNRDLCDPKLVNRPLLSLQRNNVIRWKVCSWKGRL